MHKDYAPTGCDGIYFQAFTECPKCQCPRCEKWMQSNDAIEGDLSNHYQYMRFLQNWGRQFLHKIAREGHTE